MRDDEQLGSAIRAALEARAQAAPGAAGLAAEARARLTRRRRTRAIASAVASVAIVIGGVAVWGVAQGPTASRGLNPAPATAGQTPDDGLPEGDVVVPDVWSMPEVTARQALTELGFAVDVKTTSIILGCSRPCPDTGDVVAQSPVVGTMLPVGSTVEITVIVADAPGANSCQMPHDTDGDGDVDGGAFIPADRVPDCYFVGEQAAPHDVALYHCGVLPTTFLGQRWAVPEGEEPFDETNARPEFVGTGVMGLLTPEEAVYRDASGIKIAFVPASDVPPVPCY